MPLHIDIQRTRALENAQACKLITRVESRDINSEEPAFIIYRFIDYGL